MTDDTLKFAGGTGNCEAGSSCGGIHDMNRVVRRVGNHREAVIKIIVKCDLQGTAAQIERGAIRILKTDFKLRRLRMTERGAECRAVFVRGKTFFANVCVKHKTSCRLSARAEVSTDRRKETQWVMRISSVTSFSSGLPSAKRTKSEIA